MTMDTAKSYDALARHYHLIFENWEASLERQAAVLSSILELKCGLPGTARVLDCACGIGSQSLGLAKLGFRIHSCDVSARAVERARLEASRRSLDIRFSVANVLDLRGLGDSDFDAAICMDNSLPHLESTEQLYIGFSGCQSRNRRHHRASWSTSSEPGCSHDQKQTCPDNNRPDDPHDAQTGGCDTFDSDECREDNHRANVHDPDDQKDCH